MNQTRPDALSVPGPASLDHISELARPVVAATERLRNVIEELKVARTQAVADLRRAVLNLGHDCPPEQRVELAKSLYWCHTEVPISDITVAFGFHGQAELLNVVGWVRSRATCEGCGQTLVATSRRELAELDKLADTGPKPFGRQALCRVCQKQRERAIWDEPPDELYDDDPDAWSEPA
jgi:hypothetical protein